MTQKAITIKDLAEKLNISVSTVSRALKDNPEISQQTRKTVQALAKELGPSGVRVNCIAPGVIHTQMNGNLTQEDRQILADETPLCRLGTPEEVAGAALFLSQEDASFITGQVLAVDGGIAM